MARLLALEWDSAEARFVVGREQGGELVVEEAFSAPLDVASDGEDSQSAIGTQIAAALSARRISRCDALVTVRRSGTELRVLSLPPAPDEELPDIVRFQAMRDFSELREEWPLDFFPLQSASAEKHEVLAAAISPTQLKEYQGVVNQTHNELKRLVLRPCATSSLVSNRLTDLGDGPSMIVGWLADSVELSITVDSTVVFMRSFRLPKNWKPGASGEPVIGEVRRTIAAAQNQLGAARVQRVVLCGSGPEIEQLQDRLQEKTDLPVRFLDPFADVRLAGPAQKSLPQEGSRYAALLGALLDETREARPAIDFLNPRRKPAPKSNLRMFAIAGGALAAVLLAIVSLVALKFGRLDDQINKLESQLNQLSNENKSLEQYVTQVGQVDAWKMGDVNWLDELYRISEKLPSADDARLETFQATGRNGQGGLLSIGGRVVDHKALVAIEAELGDESHLVSREQSNEDDRDPDFELQFSDTVEVSNPIDSRRPANHAVSAVGEEPST